MFDLIRTDESDMMSMKGSVQKRFVPAPMGATARALHPRLVVAASKDGKGGKEAYYSCVDFVKWAQEEHKRIDEERKERVAAARESVRAVLKQERDTLIRLIREARERREEKQREAADADSEDV